MENVKLNTVDYLVRHTNANVFLTGKAGTGKTTFLRSLSKSGAKRMVVVAPTGVAAINAKGVTIHSFFQLNFGPQIPGMASVSKLKLGKAKLNIMRSMELLVIDEISMVRADLLDAVDEVLRMIRRSSHPFGGVQVLMIGDLQQLAPVAKREEWQFLEPYYDSVYFFSSRALKSSRFVCVELEHVYRQQDACFVDLLNKIRENHMDAECVEILNSRYDPFFDPDDAEGYVTLTTHNAQAEEINETKLAAIDAHSFFFNAEIRGEFPLSSYPTLEELELKVGAQVMFVKNDPSLEKMYYNGKTGIITEIDEELSTIVVRCGEDYIDVTPVVWQNFEYKVNPDTNEIEEKEIGRFTQFPLKLAWAITIHKSQGLTFDKLIVDAEAAFAHGQVYVALSRCTSLEGLVLKSKISANSLKTDNKVNAFVQRIPDMEPDENDMDELRKEYEMSMMLDLFDFDVFLTQLSKLVKLLIDNDTLFQQVYIDDVLTCRNTVREKIVDVSHRFEPQLTKLHNDCEMLADNAALQERITKAVAYFAENLDVLINVDALASETDNQSLNNQMSEILDVLRDAKRVKMACFEACKDAFDADVYHRVHSIQSIQRIATTEKPKKEQKLVNVADDKNDSLFAALVSWRKEKAEDNEVRAYQIMHQKTLRAIVEMKPITMKDLAKVYGMGKKRCQLYGEEIISMVLQSQDLTPSEIVHDEDIVAKKIDSLELTKRLADDGFTPEQIAAERGLAISTIYGHLEKLIERGDYDASDFVEDDKLKVIMEYFNEVEDYSLTAAIEVLGDDFSYSELRMARAEMKRMK